MRRPDFQVFKFTDHDVNITYQGEVYAPAGGVLPSATRHQGSLHATNFEVDGPITSDAITVDDLRKGLWRDTEVNEFIVDWLYPSAGAIKTSRYWITETEWDGEQWNASVEGGARWLRHKIGSVFTRNCRWKLGQGFISGIGCPADLDTLTKRDVTITAVASRTQFTTGTGYTPTTRERYRFGRVIWQTGPNAGTFQEIKDYGQVAARVIELFQPTPYEITTLHRFDLEPGCDKIRSTCINEYNLLTSFGGFPFMPGTNRLLLKPRGTGSTP